MILFHLILKLNQSCVKVNANDTKFKNHFMFDYIFNLWYND